MMKFVTGAVTDADVILYVTDTVEQSERSAGIIDSIRRSGVPTIVVINKIDYLDARKRLEALVDKWQAEFPGRRSSHVGQGEFQHRRVVPDHPRPAARRPGVLSEKDTLTDKTLRFFASEIIREKILKVLRQGDPLLLRNRDRKLQGGAGDRPHRRDDLCRPRLAEKGILIGHKGRNSNGSGEAARDMEQFLGKKVFLQLFVKVNDDWRNNERQLRRFGYELE